jgi:hypothetical protein
MAASTEYVAEATIAADLASFAAKAAQDEVH